MRHNKMFHQFKSIIISVLVFLAPFIAIYILSQLLLSQAQIEILADSRKEREGILIVTQAQDEGGFYQYEYDLANKKLHIIENQVNGGGFIDSFAIDLSETLTQNEKNLLALLADDPAYQSELFLSMSDMIRSGMIDEVTIDGFSAGTVTYHFLVEDNRVQQYTKHMAISDERVSEENAVMEDIITALYSYSDSGNLESIEMSYNKAFGNTNDFPLSNLAAYPGSLKLTYDENGFLSTVSAKGGMRTDGTIPYGEYSLYSNEEGKLLFCQFFRYNGSFSWTKHYAWRNGFDSSIELDFADQPWKTWLNWTSCIYKTVVNGKITDLYTENSAPADNYELWKTYAGILRKTIDAGMRDARSEYPSGASRYIEAQFGRGGLPASSPDEVPCYGFSLIDLNGDGTPELVTEMIQSDGTENGLVKNIIDVFHWDQQRGIWNLCTPQYEEINGAIMTDGSIASRMDSRIILYGLNEDAHYESIAYFKHVTDPDNNSETYWLNEDDPDAVRLSDNDVLSLLNAHGKPVEHTFYPATEKNFDLLEQGNTEHLEGGKPLVFDLPPMD